MNYSSIILLGVLMVVMIVVMVIPQRKEQKKRDALLASMAVGDTILTTSGFYGTLIDIEDDMVIVEFGNNRNCRIPMQKSSISQVEKLEDAIEKKEKD